MTRTSKFVHDYNGVKRSRLVLTDFFAIGEVNTFTRYFLTDGRRPIDSVGTTCQAVFGIQDEINDFPVALNTIRLVHLSKII